MRSLIISKLFDLMLVIVGIVAFFAIVGGMV
jgi:hypothetical protein